jgi:multisubunit Na+/H+ antiporter MnhB subunit
VKRSGLKVVFAPDCIIRSKAEGGLADVIEWTNRQATISRVYMPNFWRLSAFVYTFQQLVVVAAVAGGAFAAGVWGALAVLCLYLALQALNALMLLETVDPMLPQDLRAWVRRERARYLAPIVTAVLMYGLNVLRSLLSRRIVWRGIRYELVSATETRVLGGVGAPGFTGAEERPGRPSEKGTACPGS